MNIRRFTNIFLAAILLAATPAHSITGLAIGQEYSSINPIEMPPIVDSGDPNLRSQPIHSGWQIAPASLLAPVPIEVEALVALYNATDGPHWTDHTGWLTDPDPCNWYGVLCASHTYPSYHVVWLHLANNNLTGQLPPEIVNLTQLDELLLNDNHLTGPLPAGMDNFDYIINLLLNNNQLTGPIPADLGGISISPSGRKLLRLFLHNNLLEGPIPPELGNISSLRYLDLVTTNSLTGEIPESLGNLTDLWEFDLSFNKLYKQIPPSLGNLTYLRKFIVSDNSLTGQIPTWLSSMPYLEELEMAYNYFNGPIPDELSAATQLKTIWLGQNQLTGNVPASLAALPDLVSLWVANNYMEGELPIALTNLELYTFWYNNTNLCEPCDNTFLNWANTIPDLRRTWPCTPGMRDDHPYIGRGGSYFPFYGYCLKANSTYILEVNNIFVTYFQTDSIGSFGFELRSDDPSEYVG